MNKTAKRGSCYAALRSDSNHGQLTTLCLKAVGKFTSQLSKTHFEPLWLARYVRRRRRRPVPRFWFSPAKSHSGTLALLLGKKGVGLGTGRVDFWVARFSALERRNYFSGYLRRSFDK